MGEVYYRTTASPIGTELAVDHPSESPDLAQHAEFVAIKLWKVTLITFWSDKISWLSEKL